MAAGDVTITHNFVHEGEDQEPYKSRGEVTPSRWNESHTLDGMSELLSSIRDSAIIDMGNDDYTMTVEESIPPLKYIINGGSGKTLTYPVEALPYLCKLHTVATTLTANDITIAYEGSGVSMTAESGSVFLYSVTENGVASFNDYLSEYVRNINTDYLLKFATAALKGTAVAGEFEFANNTPYFSPAASTRGAIPAVQWCLNQAQVSLNNNTTPQSPFSAGHDTVTLMADTLYFFEMQVYMSNGTTSTRLQTSFDGTATIDDIKYQALANYNNNSSGAFYGGYVNQASATTILGNTGQAVRNYRLTGHIKVSTGGTLIPKFNFDTAPGGTNTAEIGSYFKIWAAGADDSTSIGNFS